MEGVQTEEPLAHVYEALGNTHNEELIWVVGIVSGKVAEVTGKS